MIKIGIGQLKGTKVILRCHRGSQSFLGKEGRVEIREGPQKSGPRSLRKGTPQLGVVTQLLLRIQGPGVEVG